MKNVLTQFKKIAGEPISRKVTGIYAVVGVLWVLFSDRVLIDLVEDPFSLTYLQTVKGWVFVFVTSVMLYFLIRQYMIKINHYADELVSREEKIRASRDFFLGLLDEFPAMVWLSGTDTKFDYFNKGWLEFTGKTLEEEIGDGWADGVHPEDRDRSMNIYLDAFQNVKPFQMEYRLRRYDGEYRWIIDIGRPFNYQDGKFGGYIGSCYDISDRKVAEAKLNYLAYHDSLTGLPNRILFFERLSLELAHAQRDNKMVAVMFLDLDRFKQVNDTMGHAVGDRLLKDFAKRIKSCVRNSDTVSRLGGDEFTLLLPDIRSKQNAIQIADKIIAAMRAPWLFNDQEFKLSASIGIALYPQDSTDAESLMKFADTAMFQAKKVKDSYKFFAL